jgi:hypothetical protein
MSNSEEFMSYDEFLGLFETDEEYEQRMNDLTPEEFDALMDQSEPVDVEVDLRRDDGV